MQQYAIDPPESRVVMEDVAWATYVDLADQRRGSVPRMTYDEGTLEMMSPKRQHENIGCTIGRIVEAYTYAKGIEIISVASMTVRRSSLKKAFEPDESYYVAHAAELLAKEELDFEVDPPPDLVIEVEITRSAIQKMKLFASMNVPEVWRHDSKQLRMYRLLDHTYAAIDTSVEITGLTAALVNQTLLLRNTMGENQLIRWFNQQIGAPS